MTQTARRGGGTSYIGQIRVGSERCTEEETQEKATD